MAELIATYLAGLGFFFTGVAGVSENLQQLSGHKFRQLLLRATHHPVFAGLLGAFLGAITQSTSVVAFVLAGMTASGLIPMRRALLVLACSNIGTALLVFVAVLDLHLPTLFLIGVSGLILAFGLFTRLRPLFGALLSIGLVFFGLDIMKNAFKPLSGMHGFAHVGAFFDYWPDAAFFVGILMRTVIHSSSAAAAVTITLNHGMMDEFPSMMSLAGLGIGTALATWFLSSNLRGIPKQIALFQAIGNVASGLLLACALTLERYTGLPLILHALQRLGGTSSSRMALMYFLFNALILCVSLLIMRWAPAWLQRWCPSTPEQDLSRPQYLQTDALDAPETALDLVALEQLRIVGALHVYLDVLRGENEIDMAELHEAALTLGNEVSLFNAELARKRISKELATRVISFQRKQETLRAIEENVYLFAQTLKPVYPMPATAARMVEALDTLALSAADMLSSKDTMDLELMVRMTDDRGDMMERLRNRMSLEQNSSVEHVAAMHYATTLFERNVWLMRQLALWLEGDLRVSNS